MSSTSVPVSAALRSGSSEPECAPSASASATNSAAQSSPSTGPPSRAGQTFELFPECAESISSAAESPVSPQALPEADEDIATIAGYGMPSLKLYEHLAPRGSLRRTLSESLACDLAVLTGSPGNWQTRVIPRGRSLSPLTTWVRHISDSGYSLWPTPSATSYGSSNNGCPGDGREEYATKGKPSLETMARQGMWPTPTAGDAKSSGSRNTPQSSANFGVSLTDAVRQDGGTGRLLPTPCAADAEHRGRGDLYARLNNSGRQKFPTPSANDHKGSTKAGQRRRQLTDPSMGAIPAGGALNPTWVEWLMGFPLGWTVCARSATRSSRKSSK
jgi:hypothetical protein